MCVVSMVPRYFFNLERALGINRSCHHCPRVMNEGVAKIKGNVILDVRRNEMDWYK